jgi:hypothetical protein
MKKREPRCKAESVLQAAEIVKATGLERELSQAARRLKTFKVVDGKPVVTGELKHGDAILALSRRAEVEVDPTKARKCRGCPLWLVEGTHGLRRVRCDRCVRRRKRERKRAWDAKNPEKSRDRVRAWREKNPEKVRDRDRAWREKNPEKVREKDRAYRKKNREKLLAKQREWNRAWREKNRARIRAGREKNQADLNARARAPYAAKKAKPKRLPADEE